LENKSHLYTYIIIHRDLNTGDSRIIEIDDFEIALEQFEIRKINLFDPDNETLYLTKIIKRE
jgi:hypothetical protein